jgi:hypothetical protein
MNYGITARDYLSRAKRCLENDNVEFLFYAAFEVRCGVEARMQEYLEAQEHISKKKRQGWQLAKLAKNIEKTFKLGEKDAVLRILHKDTKKVEFEAMYTPVKACLRERVKKLGNYLHSAKKYHTPDDAFWDKLRADLEKAVEELEHATTGRLLGPLLLHPDKKHVDIKMELPTKVEQEVIKKFVPGFNCIMQVDYE